MRPDTQARQVLDLLAQRGMLRPSDLDAIEVPRMVLTRLSTARLVERVSRGLYRLPERDGLEHESLTTIATRVPQAVFCLLTALQFHALTTQLPRQVWIAMPRGSHTPRIDYPPVKMVQVAGEAYAAGIEVVERNQVPLRVYNRGPHRGRLLQTPQQSRTGRGAGSTAGRTRATQGLRG